jgi:hypothetical protein
MDAHLVCLGLDDGTCYVPFLLRCLESSFVLDTVPTSSHNCCTYWLSGVLEPRNYISLSAKSDYISGICGDIV